MIRSKVTRVKPGAQSYKMAIPLAVVQLLRLEAGDELDWDHEVVNGEIIFKVRKAKK